MKKKLSINKYMRNDFILSAFKGFILQNYPKHDESLEMQDFNSFESILSELKIFFKFSQ